MTHTFVITAKFCLCLVMWLIWKFGLRCSAGDNKNILAACKENLELLSC